MGQSTGIAWTDATWNCLRGCSRVSEGCRHCYAEVVAARFSGPGQPYEGLARKVGGEARWTGEVRFIEKHLTDPLRWRQPRRIFVNSMSDLLHDGVPYEWLDRIFAVMALAQRHTFQVLTKRPERMLEYLTGHAAGGRHVWPAAQAIPMPRGQDKPGPGWPLPNVHLGVSVEDQAAADERIPLLLRTPAAVRWVSAEPLLGPLDLTPWLPVQTIGGVEMERWLDWVVVGGESGPGHRPMDPAWLASIVAQCRAAQVPVFVKQDSGPKPGQRGRIPDALYLQQFPTGGPA